MNAVNLVPADARRGGTSVATGAPFLALVGGLVLILLGTLLFVTEHNRVDSRRSRLVAIQADAARWTAAAGAYGHDVAVAASRESTIAKVESLAGSRYDWSVLLGRLGDAMPQRSALSSLTLTPTGATTAAAATTTAAAATTTGAAATTTGASSATVSNATSIAVSACAASQSVVAQTMVNLRRLHGVSQVILSSSETGGTAGASGATSSGGCPYRVSFALTLTFAPPSAPASTAAAQAASAPSTTSASGAAQ